MVFGLGRKKDEAAAQTQAPQMSPAAMEMLQQAATGAPAAGQAMARNKTPIIIPCHRVIGSNGHLTGFGSEAVQLDLKSKLLRMENYST